MLFRSLDPTKGFDFSAQASMTISGSSGTYVLPTKLLGAGPNGTQPGRNNDYTPACTIVTNTPLCKTCLCGQPGQPVCPACGQAGQPLCATSCLAADFPNTSSPGRPRNAAGSSNSNATNNNNVKGTK